MNEYNIDYNTSKSKIILLLVPFWLVCSIFFAFFILSVLNESVWQLKIIIIILFSIGSLTLSTLLVIKISSRNINIKINNEYEFIDINFQENIIYYKDIKDIQLLPIIMKTETKHGFKIDDDKIIGYELNMKYENDKKLNMIVYIGKSEKEKINLEELFKLYKEIYKIIYNEE